MARIRTIKPEFPQSESMGRVSRDARLCFIMLWTIADDAGRLRGNSRMLASLLFPYDDDAKKLIDRWLGELETENCVRRYVVNGDSYLQIVAWTEHQKIDKPSKSKLPEAPALAPIREDSRGLGEASGGTREVSSEDLRTKEGNGREGNISAEPPGDSTPPVVLIPLVDGTEHPVSATDVAEWRTAYPAVDVAQQLQAMRQWCIANRANRKTPGGIRRFITGWLSKQQNQAPRMGAAPIGPQPVRAVPSAEETRAAIEADRAAPPVDPEKRRVAIELAKSSIRRVVA